MKGHPCRPGVARCCEVDIPLTDGDKEIVVRGIASGAISQEIVDKAIVKAKKHGTKRCAFLNDRNGRCTIYNYRPLVCVATGTTGIPSSEKALGTLLANPSEGLPFSQLSSTMCSRCHETLAKRDARLTYPALVDSQKIYDYLLDLTTASMRNFVLSLDSKP